MADKTYGDPFFGTNLKSFPGMNYPDKEFFSNQAMPAGSPFRCSWWYRTEFTLPAEYREKTAWLHFDGINYRANVWLNGQKIADAKDVAGTFRLFEFDVTKLTRGATTNALAVEVFAPEKDDLALTWVDWNPTPADKDMGLWKDVYVATSGDVSLRHPFVASKLDADHGRAALTVSADLANASAHPVKGTLKVEIEGVTRQRGRGAGGRGDEDGGPRAGGASGASARPSAPLVAVHDGHAQPVHRQARVRERRQGVRLRVAALRHPGGHVGADRQGPPALPRERPQGPDPRGGLGPRHAAPMVARARPTPPCATPGTWG